MLKKLILNRKTVPVPVPVKTLGEAIDWVGQTFLKGDQSITKIILDRKEVDDAVSVDSLMKIPLTAHSRLELLADTAEELALQSLEALRNIASIVEGTLKPMAVAAWELHSSKNLPETEGLLADLKLISELTRDFLDLSGVDPVQLKMVAEQSSRLNGALKALSELRVKREWKVFAKVLLNELEPQIVGLITESGNLQAHIFALRLDHAQSSKLASR